MPIQFFNTLSGKIEPFKPLKEGEVSLYTCGPTVYDDAHVGNFRAFVFEDLLRRFLEFEGFKVKHVMNLTDVDDKTIAGAQREKLKLEEYTDQYIQAFRKDLKALNCLPPTSQPRATKKIPQMLDLIQKLIQKGVAYENQGSVYYRVSKFPAYGKLSKKKLEMNIAGASERVDADEYESKEQVSDFVLWKAAKEGEAELGAAWDSPWGKGRPGWHIECSAMSMEELGPSFDIHAGGEDLIFPHHENEIAQSEAATGETFVRTWLHCKFLLVDGEKMSKSKGNFYTLRDLLAKGCDPMAIRYALLSTHYRSPLNFTLEGVKEAGEVIKRMDDCYWECFNRLPEFGKNNEDDFSEPVVKIYDKLKIKKNKISIALSNDLNISMAFAAVSEGIKEINNVFVNKQTELKNIKFSIDFLKDIDALFGFDIVDKNTPPKDIEEIFWTRQGVRFSEDFKTNKDLQIRSDVLRLKISESGWCLRDKKPPEPSILKKKRRAWD